MTGLIDLARLRAIRMAREPYEWAVTGALLDDGELAPLSRSFPTDGFHLSERVAGSEKHYRTFDLPIADPSGRNEAVVGSLPPRWQRFIDDLLSTEYRDALGEVTERDLGACAPLVRLCRYRPSCWIDPHTDRPDKPVTHVWYFNDRWEPAWGGSLQIMRSESPDASDLALDPEPGSTTIICASERSWHRVVPVTEAAPVDRCSVLVHFVRPDA